MVSGITGATGVGVPRYAKVQLLLGNSVKEVEMRLDGVVNSDAQVSSRYV
ncbi:hypothetical protein L345_06124, partial [Ophiophagus hannah]